MTMNVESYMLPKIGVTLLLKMGRMLTIGNL